MIALALPESGLLRTICMINLGTGEFETEFTYSGPTGGPKCEWGLADIRVLSVTHDGETKFRHEDLSGFYLADIAVMRNLTREDIQRIFEEEFSDIAI